MKIKIKKGNSKLTDKQIAELALKAAKIFKGEEK